MGAWTSKAVICNLTEMILFVRLSQITPLYYDDKLLPGKCMERTVGMVWFTVEAAPRIFDYGTSAYETLGRTAFAHYLDFSYTDQNFREFGEKIGWTPEIADYNFRQDTYWMAGPQLCYRYCLKSPGWYFGYDRKICIKYGPRAQVFDATHHNVSMVRGMDLAAVQC